MSKQSLSVLVVGPTTVVGEQVVNCLADWPVSVALTGAGDAAEAGQHFDWMGEERAVVPVEGLDLSTFRVVLWAAPGFADGGGVVVVLPGAGEAGSLTCAGGHKPAGALRIADPVAIVAARIVGALAPLDPVGVRVMTAEAASLRGRAAMDELRDQTIDLLNFREPRADVLPRRLAFDLLPESGEGTSADLTVLLPDVAVEVVRLTVPVFVGFGAHIRLRLAQAADLQTVRDALEAAAGLSLVADPALADAVGEDTVQVGRLRVHGEHVELWATADDGRVSALEALALVRSALVGA